MPDPDFSGSAGSGVLGQIDRTDPAFEDAAAACEDILSGFGPGGGGPGGGGRSG